MSKPSWKDAPEWANWLAQDEDANWYWYESEPWATAHSWDRPAKTKMEAASVWLDQWKETLEPRP